MVQYNLVREARLGNLKQDFDKICDYLLTFTGDVSVNKNVGSAIIRYTGTEVTATLTTDSDPSKEGVESSQITLSCQEDDNVSINLIKNITPSIGYRIYNPQTQSFMLNDPDILDLTTSRVDNLTEKLIKDQGLIPLFRYRDNLTFFALDGEGGVHLINRHLLSYLRNTNPTATVQKKEISVKVANSIGLFVALFDRGLIPLSFYKHQNYDAKVINLSDFDVYKMPRDVVAEVINFTIDLPRQLFLQVGSDNFKINKGENIIKSLKLKNYLVIKVASDIGYEINNNKLTPKIKIMVFS